MWEFFPASPPPGLDWQTVVDDDLIQTFEMRGGRDGPEGARTAGKTSTPPGAAARVGVAVARKGREDACHPGPGLASARVEAERSGS